MLHGICGKPANHSAVFVSRDTNHPITALYSSHVNQTSRSQRCILVMWRASANHSSVFKSPDSHQPITPLLTCHTGSPSFGRARDRLLLLLWNRAAPSQESRGTWNKRSQSQLCIWVPWLTVTPAHQPITALYSSLVPHTSQSEPCIWVAWLTVTPARQPITALYSSLVPHTSQSESCIWVAWHAHLWGASSTISLYTIWVYSIAHIRNRKSGQKTPKHLYFYG